MSKRDLRAAMDALDVKTPLRLQGARPAFVRPEPNLSTQVEIQAPGLVSVWAENGPQGLDSTEAQNRPPGPIHTLGLNQAPAQNHPAGLESTEAQKSPRGPEPTWGLDQTPVPSGPQGLKPTPGPNPTQVQNRPEGQIQAPLAKGYTRIPNEFLMRIVGGEFTRNEIKIALLIARYTISFSRKLAPLSKTAFERQCGLKGSSVLEAITSLLQKGVIQKNTGDQYHANQLGLVLSSEWDSLFKSDKENCLTTPGPKSAGGLKPTAGPVSVYPAGLEPSCPPGPNPAPFKQDLNKILNKSSLSKKNEPTIENYLQSIKAPRKKTTEREALAQLEKGFDQIQIAKALDYVLGFGSLHTGDPCHSPIKYLCSAIDEVLALVVQQEQSKAKTESRTREEKSRHQEQANEDARLEHEENQREQAFLKTFPTDQDQAQAIAQFGGIGAAVMPSGRLGRTMAIVNWWQTQNQSLTQNEGTPRL